jgi:cell division protein WhiA
MSFSSAVKNELCRLELNEDCCLKAELASVVNISGIIKSSDNNSINIKITTENAAFARRIFSGFKKLYNIYPEVIIRKSKKLKKHMSYILVITSSMGADKILASLGFVFTPGNSATFVHDAGNNTNADYGSIIFNSKKVFSRSCCRKTYLRGAFLAGGSVSDPEKTYHLEITVHNLRLGVEINGLLKKYRLNAKIIRRKSNYVVYVKEGENIVDFLNIIGAHSALMELENVRIIKDMRNNVNRIVNCETANLDKTVNASLRQIENIE